MKKPIAAIIGMGPVGSVLTAHLAKSGEDVVAVDILEDILSRMRKEGLKVSGITGLTVRITKTANSISQLAEYDPEIIFLATKASVLKPVLSELKKIYTSGMKIVSYQNGLDNERIIAETLGIDVTYRAVINYAGNIVGPGNVSMNWFQPPNYIGVLRKGEYTTDETTQYIAKAMTASGLETEEAPNIKGHVWKKTILNSALCSLCAVTRQTMKEAMEHEYSRDLAVRLVEEGLMVAKADGYDFGPNATSEFISYLEKGGAHKPSMLIDVEKKRATEVDFMSGAVARYGTMYRIPTPVNSIFTNLLKTIENQYLTP
ncbi:MAG: 2-dehydropantoate 2-reductase [Candidatus Bathyarchaeota archaeon]|nr:MAG: 2-dehydropantoate 2-reductase [Candidatus Bathyarchaeota archaeon]